MARISSFIAIDGASQNGIRVFSASLKRRAASVDIFCHI